MMSRQRMALEEVSNLAQLRTSAARHVYCELKLNNVATGMRHWSSRFSCQNYSFGCASFQVEALADQVK
jgi:hypothetical protein